LSLKLRRPELWRAATSWAFKLEAIPSEAAPAKPLARNVRRFITS
jgi:hypothetical protein